MPSVNFQIMISPFQIIKYVHVEKIPFLLKVVFPKYVIYDFRNFIKGIKNASFTLEFGYAKSGAKDTKYNKNK